MSFDFPNVAQEKEKCKNFIQNFTCLDHVTEQSYHKYMHQLQEISDRRRKILEISMDDILKFNSDDEFWTNIKNNTFRYISLFEEVADKLMPATTAYFVERDVFDILQSQRNSQIQRAQTEFGIDNLRDLEIPKSLTRRYEISFLPSKNDIPRKLREIKASDIGRLVVVKGIITRASDVKPHISVCTYTCDVCGSEIFQEVSGSQFMPLSSCPSRKCSENKSNGRVHMQTRGSRFSKYQELKIQELPDQVPVGHIPRTMTIKCRGELTRLCGPGDVVTVSGLFLTVKFTGFRAIKAGLQADTYLDACNIQKEKISFNEMERLELTDERIVREIARQPDPYSLLASSIAPEIFGHDDVKKALLLQLVGGVTRILPDGMKIRGDINICLMGDPGVAKSQLLKYIASVAPRGVYTTGKGSSGVGLTAAVVKDTMSGDLALEGGALVLADMGICCIDEFDKMDESDRTAIHEVMEQQTVSIAKAGITTTLNARTAVLAAANPLYGRYNKRKSISENVDLPNSLLSRFDLLFLLIDKVDTDADIALSKHILHVHKHLRTPEKASNITLPTSAIKHYIAAARTINPTVPKDLTPYIVEAYVNLRQQDSSKLSSRSNDQTVMTPRQLLSILRLSQSLARLRLSNTVSPQDVEEAIRLTHASKASLLEDFQHNVEDATSSIYSLIRDMILVRGMGFIGLAHVQMMILKKGFTQIQLDNCLREYESLGILHIDGDRSNITLIE